MAGFVNSYKMTAAKLLQDARKANGIEVESICFGLCDEQTYYRIENGIQEPDALLFAFIWERLGGSLNRVNIVMNVDEIEWFIMKKEAGDAIRDKNIERLRCIRQGMGELDAVNKSVAQQFLDYLDYAIIMMDTGISKGAYEHIRNSVFRTMGDPFKLDFARKHPGQEETQFLCSYMCAELKYNNDKEKEIHRCLIALLRYFSLFTGDPSASSGVLSRLASTECAYFGERADINSIESAVTVMRKAYFIGDMPALLYVLGKCGTDQSMKYRIWGETLESLCSEFGTGYSFREEAIYIQIPHINEVCDFIRSGRLDKGYTQADTSEGICEPENYSRIERGRRKPHTNNLKRILNKLGLEWGYFNGIVITNSYECFMHRIQLDHALRMMNTTVALDMLELLESELDMSIPQNRQYCGDLRVSIDLIEGRITPEEAVKRLTLLLELTGATGDRIRYYSPQESSIMLNLAQLYRRGIKKPDVANSVINKYIANEKRKKVPNLARINQFLRVKAGICGDLMKWEEEKSIAFSQLQYIFRSNCAEMIEQYQDLYVEGMEEGKPSSENAKRLLIAAMHMAELYYELINMFKIKSFIEENLADMLQPNH